MTETYSNQVYCQLVVKD